MSTYQLLKDTKFSSTTVFVAEYVWIDGDYNLRSKARTLPMVDDYQELDNIPSWNYDGSSTKQAITQNSDVILKPVASFLDPFRGYPHILVLCDTYEPSGKPLANNNRAWSQDIFDVTVEEHKPWYGMEQEVFFMNTHNKPIGFPMDGNANKQGDYYCGVGAGNIFGRELIDKFYQYCIYANIKVAGINAEVANSQWEFQIGPCSGLEVGDHLWMARYILGRVGEDYGVKMNYHPKPLTGEWNGSGLHTNFSTQSMREEEGLHDIKLALKKLEMRHKYHMENYGKDNFQRMTGGHETAYYHTFTWGIRDRSASVRIPPDVAQSGKGYLEDRRPASNADPYLVAGLIYDTIIHEIN